MTDKELRKLTRAELLEMLISQMKENERLQEQVEELAAQLEDRRIMLEEAGSIAEASLRLNGVFQAAEKAAQQYLENIKRLSDEKITPRKEVRK
ncbi:MAG: DNA repair protein [Clostridia bacterium]|nr:DNA repair protein [Clostridia bacterium]MBQ3062401.1 DNA repair protein [Clostridia bacterium]